MFHKSTEDIAPAVIGLTFLPKKLPRVLTRGLLAQAEAARLQLLALDPHTPIAQQNREVDIIVHKLPEDAVWASHLSAYQLLQPNVRILDPPAAIAATRDRARMLTAVPPSGLELHVNVRQPAPTPPPQQPLSYSTEQYTPAGDGAAVAVVRLRAPPQVLLTSRADLRELVAAGMAAAGITGSKGTGVAEVAAGAAKKTALKPPLILKTQFSDAAGDSGHGLAVALEWSELAAAAEQLQCCAGASGGGDGGGGSASGGGGGGGDGEGVDTGDGGGGGQEVDGRPGEDSRWVPLVVQQYVPHSEALYKVYVMGTEVRVERRPSLTTHRMTVVKQQQHHHQQQQQQHDQQSIRSDHQPTPPSPNDPEPSHHPLNEPAAPTSSTPPNATHSGTGSALLLHGLSAQRDMSATPTTAAMTGCTSPSPSGGAPAVTAAAVTPTPTAAAVTTASGTPISTAAAQTSRYLHELAPPSAPLVPGGGVVEDHVLAAIARELSRRMDLTLFNFDLVVPEEEKEEEEGEGEEVKTERAAAAAAVTEQLLVSGGREMVPVEAGAEAEAEAAKDVIGGQQQGLQQQAAALQQGITQQQLALEKTKSRERQFYVVDINYFPGYDKLPGWEGMMVRHLRALADQITAARAGSAR